ncbi:phosphoglycolate/pyridoxal phosphate phosphatase [Candida albicans P37039]|nr:phosphoglycolate/pyridoxal phosphate phosphatase [Candida albicans P37039]
MTTLFPTYIDDKALAQDLILSQFDNFLIDCDGVIWLSEQLLSKINQFLQFLTKNNKRFTFVTNNSSKSRQSYVTKFKNLGKDGVTIDQIYTTGYSAVLQLKKMGILPGEKIWVLGDEGIEDELLSEGYIPLGGSNELLNQSWSDKNPLLIIDPEVRAVIAGSTLNFNYMRIATTLQYLMHNDKTLPFIGTNGDRNYPGSNGLTLPAGGSMVEYMAYSSQRDYVNVGKPDTTLAETILANTGYDKSKTIMIGDTLYSDIKFGNEAQLGGDNGSGTLLVLSGVTDKEELTNTVNIARETKQGQSLVPRYYIDSLTKLIELLEE